MTTTKESPDSGAGAGPLPHTHEWVCACGMPKAMFDAAEPAPEPFGYVRREDTTSGEFTSLHTQIQGFEDDEFNTPIYTRAQDSGQGEAALIRERDYWKGCAQATAKAWTSATPAQDAAGKGVEFDEWIATAWPMATLSMRSMAHAAWDAAMAAKPAQVGEKYREFTIDDAKRISRRIRFLNGDPVDKWAVLLQELKAIGAVVPAQDGGV